MQTGAATKRRLFLFKVIINSALINYITKKVYDFPNEYSYWIYEST